MCKQVVSLETPVSDHGVVDLKAVALHPLLGKGTMTGRLVVSCFYQIRGWFDLLDIVSLPPKTIHTNWMKLLPSPQEFSLDFSNVTLLNLM